MHIPFLMVNSNGFLSPNYYTVIDRNFIDMQPTASGKVETNEREIESMSQFLEHDGFAACHAWEESMKENNGWPIEGILFRSHFHVGNLSTVATIVTDIDKTLRGSHRWLGTTERSAKIDGSNWA